MPRIPVPQRRAALIQAALRVIAQHGVAAATTRAIAAEAGMSLASVHYAFESREELISYVVEESARAAIDALPTGADLVSTIREGLKAYLALVIADPQREQAMFELNQYALRTPGLADAAKRQYESYHRVATEVLTVVAEQTGREWTKPMPEMARILITLTDGITLAWLVDRDTAAAGKVIDFAADALAALGRTKADALAALGRTKADAPAALGRKAGPSPEARRKAAPGEPAAPGKNASGRKQA